MRQPQRHMCQVYNLEKVLLEFHSRLGSRSVCCRDLAKKPSQVLARISSPLRLEPRRPEPCLSAEEYAHEHFVEIDPLARSKAV